MICLCHYCIGDVSHFEVETIHHTLGSSFDLKQQCTMSCALLVSLGYVSIN